MRLDNMVKDSLTLIPNVATAKTPKFTREPVKMLFKAIRKHGTRGNNTLRNRLAGFSDAYAHQRREVKASKPSISAHSFKYIGVLGEGAFGRVFQAQMKHTRSPQNFCAVKVVSKSNPRSKARFYKDLMVEREILERVAGNPHFIELEACWHSNVNFYFLTPVYPSCLRRRIYQLGGLPPEDARFYMAHLVYAVEFLHSQGIVHRDLKPDNIFIKDNGHLVLGDFGLAAILTFTGEAPPGLKAFKFMKSAEPKSFRLTRRGCGTPAYSAPEIYASQWYGFAVDVWALGIIHYEMLAARTPFNEELKIVDLGRSIMTDEVRFPDKVWEEQNAKAFVEKLLTRNPLRRPTMMEVRRHSYLSGFDWTKIKDQAYEAPFKPSRLKRKVTIQKPWPGFENERPDDHDIPSFNFMSSRLKKTIATHKPYQYGPYMKKPPVANEACISTPFQAYTPPMPPAPTKPPPFFVRLDTSFDAVLFSHISQMFRGPGWWTGSSLYDECASVAAMFPDLAPADVEEGLAANPDSSTLPQHWHFDIPNVSPSSFMPTRLSYIINEKKKRLSGRCSQLFHSLTKKPRL